MLVQGHKKGESNPRTPVIAQDSVSSVQTVKILYGLAEGEIAGLANGAESIRLEKTPIRTNGVDNFKNVSFDVRNGTNDQSHIAGFDSVVNEIGVSVELRHDRPFARAFTNLQLSAVAVRLKWDRLAQTNIDNGDVSGYRIDYAIDVMTDGGAWIEVLSAKVEDKASAGYVRTHRIDLPTAKKGWQIRVRRITANSTSEYISDKMYVDAVQEIIDSKLRYPNTALLALQYDAKAFQNIAKLAVRLKGKIIRVPSNYNAQNRTYSGLWDGTFIEAYSNNPAWVFYDLCLSKRYGIGSRLDASMVDKWSLYEMGRYCDELVDDGKGGKEPRFTVNLYLQKTEDAYHVLSQLAGVFRALSYWNGQSIVVNADVPKDPVFTYSRANVVDGLFKYTGSRARDRHTVVKVAWDDPNNDFETDYEWVKDEEAIARLGIRQLDISAFGCTSQAQAYRVGQWALLSEQLETQQVSFKTGLDGFIPQVGDIINISDEIFAGRANGGRVSAINTAKDAVTLDRDVVAKVGDTLLINGADATETRAIVAVNGRVITVDKPFDSVEPQHVWAINSPDLQLMQFRVMSITKDDETFTITGVQYEPKKFTGIESSVKVTPRKITVNDAYRIDAPGFVNLSQSIATHQGQAVTTLTISWGQVAMASHYQVEWRKDGGSWIVMPKQSGVSADIVGVYAGNYEARVTAISPFDVASLATNSALTTITGKQGKPPALANIKAVGKLFGMDVSWVFANGSSDANYTEIQVASNANGANAVLLGMYSYPTNNTTINGLQGNLTQYYRGRIVDKLGNVSDWSNWVSGTTDASADKVLTLLSGQITQTQLAQDLATPIGKIPTLEAGVAKIPALEIGVGKIPSIEISVNTISQNLSVTNANLASETAKLNAAVADIEKSKQAIANAVVDVDTLKKDGAEFKQEISGIKSQQNALSSEIQTINNSYASADLALSQRIDTIKSASDKAAADITTINQTKIDANQAQAIATSTTNAKFDALAVGGRNLALNSGVVVNSYATVIITTNLLVVGEKYTLSFDYIGTPSGYVFLNEGVGANFTAKPTDTWQRGSVTFVFTKNDYHGRELYPHVYGATSLRNIKLERGNIATDWTPAPEDVDAKFATTDATINEFKQTQATKDSATAERINSIDAAYKSADGQTNAKVATLEKTVSDADSALSQRIDTIKSASDKAAADITTINQTKIDANQAQAIATSTTNAKFDALAVGGRNLALNSGVVVNSYATVIITTNLLVVGEKYTLSFDYIGTPSGYVFLNEGVGANFTAKPTDTWQRGSVTFVFTKNDYHGRELYPHVYGATSLRNIKLERGNIATDWTPAPEDVDAKFATTDATINEFKQTQATKDSATAERINSIDAAYKSADGQTNAKVATLEKTVSDADSALSQRISSLDASYKSDNATTNARIAAEETARANADSATAQRVGALETGSANANSRIASLETATSDNKQAIATTQQQLTAKFSVQDTRNDNQPPSWYYANYPRQTVKEFKFGSVIGIGVFYAYLETTVRWGDASGGAIVQTAYDDSGNIFVRQGFGSTWAAWTKQENVTGSQAKVNEAKRILEGRISATDATINEFKQTQATKDSATAERINSIDAAYKSADGQTNAKVATLEKTVSDADSALSQRIDTIKSASDKAAADITTINQTKIDANQAQAIATSTTNAKFDALAVGGRNLALNSGVVVNSYATVIITTNLLVVGEKYTLSFDYIGTPSGYVFLNEGVGANFTAKPTDTWQRGSVTFVFTKNDYHGRELYPHVYGATSLRNIKLERGNIATDWTPAPEDVDAKFATTDATINEFKQTQATKDSATAERINSIDAAYKSADGQTNAKVATLEKTVSDADSALSQRISSLDASYKSDNATTNARIAAEETARANADSATAQRVGALETGSANANSRIASLETATSDNKQAIATTQQQLTAKFSVQDTRNDNQPPSWYYANYPRQTVKEFKFGSVIGIGVLYAYLETTVRWGDASGGAIVQTAYDDSGNIFVRQGFGSTWAAWTKQENVTGSQAKVNEAKRILEGRISATDATINEFKQTQATKDSATAERINSIDAAYKSADGQTNAKVATLEKTVSDADSALSQRISSLDASYKSDNATTNARIAAEETARANADSATAQRVGALETGSANANSRIASLETATSDNKQAIATTQQQLTAKFSVQDTRNDNQPPSWYYANYPRQTVKEFKFGSVIGIGVFYAYLETTVRWGDASGGAIVQTAYDDSGNIFVRQGFGSTWAAWTKQENVTGSQAKVNEAKRILEGRISATDATINEFKQTQATKDSATATQISTLQTSVGNNTSSIQQQQQSINGLYAQWSIKVDVNGHVAGVGLANTGVLSSFIVNADSFFVSSPGGGNGVSPFMVLTSSQTINGTVVPAGTYIKGDLIATGSISGDKITAKTEINAPIIKGGSININDKFIVKENGDLIGKSGTFEGTVLADKISGTIDVESLKKSAWLAGYKSYVSLGQVGGYAISNVPRMYSSQIVSLGSLVYSLGNNNFDVGAVLFEIKVNVQNPTTVNQLLLIVDDYVDLIVNGVPIGIYGTGRVDKPISFNLTSGINTIQWLLRNTYWGTTTIVLLGDFVDNQNIKFA